MSRTEAPGTTRGVAGNAMQVVIIAGGKGTRLGKLTVNQPKVLLPVAGRPFLEWVLENLERQGRTRIHLCLGVHAAQVERYLNARPPSRLSVTTSVEHVPLGTAGCLRHALPYLEDAFVLLFGDTYTPVDFAEIEAAYRRAGTEALMVVYENRDALERSNVRAADGLVREYRKGAPEGTFQQVDYGIAVCDRRVVERVPVDRFTDLTPVLHALMERSQLAAHEVRTRFYEIGSVRGYAELRGLAERGELARGPVSRGPV